MVERNTHSVSQVARTISWATLTWMLSGFFLCQTCSEASEIHWKEWSSWSECSSSCGPGIATRSRECNRDRLGGRHVVCTGKSLQHKVCLSQVCSTQQLSSRQVACSQYDTKVFSGKRYTWEPYIHPTDPCKLSCRAKDVLFYANLPGRADDGTPCGGTVGLSRAVCFQGTCKPVGCDDLIDSQVVPDKCGVCQGDNTSCKTISGIFTSTELKRGLNYVLSIPAGSRGINITELQPSRNVLYLQTISGQTIINGESTGPRTKDIQAAGTYFNHLARSSTIARETIISPGPTNETLVLKLNVRDLNPAIFYTFNVPNSLTDSVLRQITHREPPEEVAAVVRHRSQPLELTADDSQTSSRSTGAPAQVSYLNGRSELQMKDFSDDSAGDFLTVNDTGADVDNTTDGVMSTASGTSTAVTHDVYDASTADTVSKTSLSYVSDRVSDTVTTDTASSDAIDSDTLKAGVAGVHNSDSTQASVVSDDLTETVTGGQNKSLFEQLEVEQDTVHYSHSNSKNEGSDDLQLTTSTGNSEGTTTDAERDIATVTLNNAISRSLTFTTSSYRGVGDSVGPEIVTVKTSHVTEWASGAVEGATITPPRKEEITDTPNVPQIFISAKTSGSSDNIPKYSRNFTFNSKQHDAVNQQRHQRVSSEESRLSRSRDTRGNFGNSPSATIRVRQPRRKPEGAVTSREIYDSRRGHETRIFQEEVQSDERQQRERQVNERRRQLQERQRMVEERRRTIKEQEDLYNQRLQEYNEKLQQRRAEQERRRVNRVAGKQDTPEGNRAKGRIDVRIQARNHHKNYTDGRDRRNRHSESSETQTAGTSAKHPDSRLSQRTPEVDSRRENSGYNNDNGATAGRQGNAHKNDNPNNYDTERFPAEQSDRYRQNEHAENNVLRIKERPRPVNSRLTITTPTSALSGNDISIDGPRDPLTSNQINSEDIPSSNEIAPGNVLPNQIFLSSEHSSRNAAYEWRISGLTDCTHTCGGGAQKTVVVCVDIMSQAVVTDDNCRHVRRPEVVTLSCNKRPCPAVWTPGLWTQCSKSCGQGEQSRVITCMARVSPTLNLTMPPENCEQQEKPDTAQVCSVQPCTAWRVGDWTKCSAGCGDGQRTRDVQCVDLDNSTLSDDMCSDLRPISEERCNLEECGKGWYFSEWLDECPANCGTGEITRHVYCGDDDGTPVPDERCDSNQRPATNKSCRASRPCGGAWFTGPWSNCDVMCGPGSRRREVLCIKAFAGGVSAVVGDENCDNTTRPPSVEACQGPTCVSQWYMTAWSQCSHSCGTGHRTREVKCLTAEHKTSEHCQNQARPKVREHCNSQACQNVTVTIGTNAVSSQGPDCEDKSDQCVVVKRARLCRYGYYKSMCCKSCSQDS